VDHHNLARAKLVSPGLKHIRTILLGVGKDGNLARAKIAIWVTEMVSSNYVNAIRKAG